MTDAASALREFQLRVTRRLGLSFEEYRRDNLAEVLRDRTAACGCPEPNAYLAWLATPAAADEWSVLVGLLTVTETYFLRGAEHFAALVDTVVPGLRRSPDAARPLRLLSAGCASGEEAYSLAIALRPGGPESDATPAEIAGIDLNRAALAKARRGRYTAWSLRETPATVRETWFRPVSAEFELDPAIRRAVVFHERNLAEPADDLWAPESLDVVFCRNMLMYFSPGQAAALVGRIERALVPGGCLFLGHAETLRGLSQGFHLRCSHGAFYYQRRGDRPAGDDSVAARPVRPAATPAAESSADWMEQIDRASARIATLAATAHRPPPVPVRVDAPPDAQLGRVIDLHRQERFAEALAQLEGLPAGAGGDVDLLVLRAILLVNCGRFAAAEALCLPLLGSDELNAGAHYIAALCREQAGDDAAGEEHARAAAYLDPGFAMPHFHLGRLCRRQGRSAEALGHFEQARSRLIQEDPARLLLFGGGFSRETLLQACRGEIARLLPPS